VSKVLVCDDEQVLRALVRATLDGTGHEVVEARDGDEALVQARLHAPDLILLDMMMPGRSGIDVLAELRRDTVLCRTPVVMLSARTQLSDREAAVEAGVDRYMPKPFSPLELAEVVEQLLKQTA
jgi:two-component system, OmpR family, phosphate regulon response regulator PhoB